jgi:nucleoside-diphosphate-sugar epimerase
MIKNVLVVGGAGYIGGAVTDILLTKKIPFTVYDNLTYEQHFLKPVKFIFGDVRDRKKLKKILSEYSHVIWLAAIVGDGACSIKPYLTKEINQESVAWLSKHFSGRILFTSTCSVYGVSDKPTTETSPTNPLSIYAQTKLAAENYLDKKNALIFRLGTAFGISDAFSRIRMDLAINYMSMSAIKNKQLTVFGGKQWRPFIHVKDIGAALVNNLDKKISGTYNLATQNATILEIAKMIQKQTKCKVNMAEHKYEDDRSYNAVITKALRDGVLTKETKYTIPFGISEVVELVKSNRIKNLELELYSNERFLLQAIQQYETAFKPYGKTHADFTGRSNG